MPFLIPIALIAAGFGLKSILPSADSNNPLRDMTNLLMVAGTMYIGYKVVKKGF